MRLGSRFGNWLACRVMGKHNSWHGDMRYCHFVCHCVYRARTIWLFAATRLNLVLPLSAVILSANSVFMGLSFNFTTRATALLARGRFPSHTSLWRRWRPSCFRCRPGPLQRPRWSSSRSQWSLPFAVSPEGIRKVWAYGAHSVTNWKLLNRGRHWLNINLFYVS